MTYLLQAQAAAQFASLLIFAVLARWYVVPWVATKPRADALLPLLWVHAFRYIALQAFAAQHNGFPISDAGLREIVIGDVTGTVLALAAIFALRYRSRVGLLFAWALVAETVYDTVTNIRGGMREHLLGAATDVTWLILAIYVPLILVSLYLIAWQLITRRHEPLQHGVHAMRPAVPQPSREQLAGSHYQAPTASE